MPGVLVPRAPAGLYGRLFSPGPGDVVRPACLRIEGWLAWRDGTPGSLRIRCGQQILGATTRFLPLRKDAGLPVPEDLRDVLKRWQCYADLSSLTDGEQRLDVEVELADLGWVVLDSVCVVVSASDIGVRPLGGFTNLPDGVKAMRGPIRVTGVALHANGPVRAVVLNLGRLPVARAMVDRPSPDAAREWPLLPWAAEAGWQAEVDLSLTETATTELSVDALLPGDEWVRLASTTVRILERA